MEFLDEVEKEKIRQYNEKKSKIMDVVTRRRQYWESQETQRQGLNIERPCELVEYEFIREEVIKSEEKLLID